MGAGASHPVYILFFARLAVFLLRTEAQSLLNNAGLAGSEVSRMWDCTNASNNTIDMWTQRADKLADCVTACPASSILVGSDQCVTPDSFATQLKLRFKLLVTCSSSITLCQIAHAFESASSLLSFQNTSTSHASLIVAATRLKIAQCLRIPWQEVSGGLLIWSGNDILQTFKYDRSDDTWTRLLKKTRTLDRLRGSNGTRCNDSDCFEFLLAAPRELSSQFSHVEYAWRVDSYRLSPSLPSSLLSELLQGVGSGISNCLGLPVGVAGVEWITSSSASDLTVVKGIALQPRFQFQGFNINVHPQEDDTINSTSSQEMTTSTSQQYSTPQAFVSHSWVSTSNRSTSPPPLAQATVATNSPNIAPEGDSTVMVIIIASGASVTLGCFGLACYLLCKYRASEATSARKDAWNPPVDIGPPPHVGGNRVHPQSHTYTHEFKAQAPSQTAGRNGNHPRSGAFTNGFRTQASPQTVGNNAFSQASFTNPAGNETFSGPDQQQHSTAGGQQHSKGERQSSKTCIHIYVGEAEEFRPVKVHVASELERAIKEKSLAERRHLFKDLCLAYHPDKNNQSAESKSVFQFLQLQKSQFLRDDA